MALRRDDQDYRWPRSSERPQPRDEQARGEVADGLSLQDTLRELAVTVAGFVGVIVLVIAAIGALHT